MLSQSPKIAAFLFGHFVFGILFWEEISDFRDMGSDDLHPVATHTAIFWTVWQNVERLQRLFAPVLIVTLTCDCWSSSKAAMASPVEGNVACAYSILNSRCHQIIWNMHEALQMEKLLGYATAVMKKDQTFRTAVVLPQCQALNYISVWTFRMSLGITRPSSKGCPVRHSKHECAGFYLIYFINIPNIHLCCETAAISVLAAILLLFFFIKNPTKQCINY